MRRRPGASVVLSAIGPLLAAGLLMSGCASGGTNEWQVAADPDATADEIIDAGRAVDISTSEDQMVVTWEVRPEDDEGPYQGAWRLYNWETGEVADGTFGTVRESSARIDVAAIDDGFLLTDYVKQDHHILDREGRLVPAQFEASEPGPALAGGILVPDTRSDGAWNVLLPSTQQVVSLTGLPTEDVQGVELTSDGTVWVLMPWTSGDRYEVAFAKDGKPPWTTEAIPLPRTSGTDGERFSASGRHLYVVGFHERGDRTAVDVILEREAGAGKTWKRIDASGIPDDLVGAPEVERARKGRLLATSGGEGSWIQKEDDSAFIALTLPRGHKPDSSSVSSVGAWLWSSEDGSGNSLRYSYNHGETWREFER